MRLGPLPEVDTLDRGSLESFITELIEAGFEPSADSDRREWVGPAHPSLSDMTDADQMRIQIRDGWPFIPPYVFVRGLSADHVSARGIICLWRDDDPSMQWRTLAGLYQRLIQWVEFAMAGNFRPGDLALDSHIGFEKHAPDLATFELWSLVGRNPSDGDHGAMLSKQLTSYHLELVSESADATLRGHWFYRNRIDHPPRTLDEFKASLKSAQRRAFDRNTRDESERPGLDIVVLVWKRGPYHDVLPLRLRREGGALNAEALEPAPYDQETLLIRAGPDAKDLLAKRVCVFGLGAVGSHCALQLAQSGVGHLKLIDGDRLRPGNVVRHAGDRGHVGWPKTEVLRELIERSAPWTSVEVETSALMAPSEIRDAIQGNDLVLDATGSVPITQMLSMVAEDEGIDLVSASLFRAGRVARVRRQVAGRDSAIHLIIRESLGTQIPADLDEHETLEIGCSAPVNNATPASVLSVSATATMVVMDSILHSFEYKNEVIQVYRPIEGANLEVVSATSSTV
jgi:molybdopterin/thiamine biosynthesis adenylyltransferase